MEQRRESTISALTLAVQQRLESYSRENWHKNCEPNTNSRIHMHPKETPQPRPGYTYDSKAARKESDRILAEEEAKRSKSTDVTASSHDTERTRSL